MNTTFPSVNLQHRIPGTQVRAHAFEMWNDMVTVGTAPAGHDFIDLVPKAADALIAEMLTTAAALGITLPTTSRTMTPAYDLRITFSFADKTDAFWFKVALF